MHINVTYSPSAEWAARQLYQAFPFDSAPKYLVRDRDGIYGHAVVEAVRAMGIEETESDGRRSVSLSRSSFSRLGLAHKFSEFAVTIV